jgi:hypothetical protein
MKRLSLLAFTCTVFFLVSCESDQVTTNNNAKIERKLIVSPTHLEADQYKEYTFKARISDLPINDPLYRWDFDDSVGFQPNYWTTTRAFNQNRIYTVRVKALDAFTEEQIGYDSIRVDVRPPAKFVELTPATVDTLLPMSSGGFTPPITFNVSSSTPAAFIVTEWDFGDGSPLLIDSFSYGWTQHSFIGGGTFHVHVSVYERETGIYVGSDSSVVTIRFPPFTYDDLIESNRVVVLMDVSNGHPITQDPLFTNPFAIMLPLKTDSISTVASQFGTDNFTLAFKQATTGSRWRTLLDTITGNVSTDLRRIDMLRVAVSDTGELQPAFFPGFKGGLAYSYILRNLDLLAVTPNQIVYRTKQSDVMDFASDINFRASLLKNHPCGMFGDSSFPSDFEEAKQAPFALVIFVR